MSGSSERVDPDKHSKAEFLFPETTRDFDKLPVEFKVYHIVYSGIFSSGQQYNIGNAKGSISDVSAINSTFYVFAGLLRLHAGSARSFPPASQSTAGPTAPQRQVLRLLQQGSS